MKNKHPQKRIYFLLAAGFCVISFLTFLGVRFRSDLRRFVKDYIVQSDAVDEKLSDKARAAVRPAVIPKAIWLDKKLDCSSDIDYVPACLKDIRSRDFNACVFSSFDFDNIAKLVDSADPLKLYPVFSAKISSFFADGSIDRSALQALAGSGVRSVLLIDDRRHGNKDIEKIIEALRDADESLYIGFYLRTAQKAAATPALSYDYLYVDIDTRVSDVTGDYSDFLKGFMTSGADTVFGFGTELGDDPKVTDAAAEYEARLDALTGISFDGFAVHRYGTFNDDNDGVLSLVTDRLESDVMRERFKTLELFQPKETTFTTYDPTLSVSGSGDKYSSLTMNSQKVSFDDEGCFNVNLELSEGKNRFLFEHKGRSVELVVTYEKPLIVSITPDEDMISPGGTDLRIVVLAEKGSAINASLGSLKAKLKPDKDIGAEPPEAGFEYYTAVLHLQGSSSKPVELGKIMLKAEKGRRDQSFEAAEIKINKKGEKFVPPLDLPDASFISENSSSGEDGASQPGFTPEEYNGVPGRSAIVRITEPDTEAFPADTLNDVSTPFYSSLPEGTLDYVTDSCSYEDFDYYILGSGRRIYKDSAEFFSTGYDLPANRVRLLSVDREGVRLIFRFSTDWRVPFNVSGHPQEYFTKAKGRPYCIKDYTARYIDIDFDYTVSHEGSPQFSSSLFSKAEWLSSDKGSTTLRLYLKTEGRFYGFKQSYDGDVLTISFKERTNNSLKGKTVMLDAGHGGADPGAIGPKISGIGHVREADVDFSLTGLLKKELELRGARVVLTRSSANQTLELDERARLCRETDPDVFISVHCDAAGAERRGTSAYYFKEYSYDLAYYIHKNLLDAYKNDVYTDESDKEVDIDRGVSFKGFRVTRVDECPSVLIEFGFITNKEECKILTSDEYAAILALACTNGIEQYFAES